MLWLLVLLVVICLTMPLSNESPSKDINLYKYGDFVHQHQIQTIDKYKNL